MCLLDKHDKCNVSKLAVTIKIQYLCVLKVHKIITGKKKKNPTYNKTNLSSSQRYKYTVQIYFISKTVQIKMQQNRDINALLKSGRCRVFLREHFWSTTLRLLIKINTYWYGHTILKLTIQSPYNLDYT